MPACHNLNNPSRTFWLCHAQVRLSELEASSRSISTWGVTIIDSACKLDALAELHEKLASCVDEMHGMLSSQHGVANGHTAALQLLTSSAAAAATAGVQSPGGGHRRAEAETAMQDAMVQTEGELRECRPALPSDAFARGNFLCQESVTCFACLHRTYRRCCPCKLLQVLHRIIPCLGLVTGRTARVLMTRPLVAVPLIMMVVQVHVLCWVLICLAAVILHCMQAHHCTTDRAENSLNLSAHI